MSSVGAVSWSLSEQRRATLVAALARLLPGDDAGPGALEAGVPGFIEQALSRELAQLRSVYEAGLDELDAEARRRCGRPFAELAGADADDVIAAAEADGAPFFDLLLGDAIDGLLGSPTGWELVGYPGPRVVVTAAEQEVTEL